MIIKGNVFRLVKTQKITSQDETLILQKEVILMKRNDQEIQGGDNSQNYQANGDINVNGLNYDQVEKLFMTMFKANFYDLQEEAKEIANKRAEEITNKFIEKIVSVNPKLLEKSSDPDIRYDIFEAQKSYARTGNAEQGELLTELLVQRMLERKEGVTFRNIVVNEAIEVASKLTNKQIDILSLIYLVQYLSFNPVLKLSFDHYYGYLERFPVVDIPTSNMFYQHLQYSGCISISIGSRSFDDIFLNKFPYLFSDKNDVDLHIKKYENLVKLKNKWDATTICHTDLTSVGLVIAITNLKIKSNYVLGFDFWLQEE